MKHELILYVGEGCPYCRKVLNFMNANDIALPIKEVWENEANMQELIHLSKKQQVPCLSIDGEPLLESDDIIEKLKEIYDII